MSSHQVKIGRRRLFGFAAALLTAPGILGVARAAGEPEAVVHALVQQIIDLLSTGELTQESGLERLDEVIKQETDLNTLARLALARHWRDASEEQQRDYEELFRQLMLRKFVGHLGAYSNQNLGPEQELFEITGSRTVGGDDVIVDSVVRPPDRKPVNVAWRLRQRDSGPVIIDVVIENVSLLITQRSEFTSVIERDGMDGLLAELRARLEGGEPS